MPVFNQMVLIFTLEYLHSNAIDQLSRCVPPNRTNLNICQSLLNIQPVNTKLKMYQNCIFRTLLYGSKSWTTYTRQENSLENFHLCILRRILGISWQDKVTNTKVLATAGSLSVHLMLFQRCLLGHVHRVDDGCIPKDLLYGDLTMRHHPTGRSVLWFNDICKRDLKLTDDEANSWELLSTDHGCWHHTVCKGVRRGEEKRSHHLEDKGQQPK